MLTKHLKRLRLQMVILSIAWIAATIWLGFVEAPGNAFLTKESPEVLDRLDRECTGSYQMRYDCKNSIAIEVSNHALIEGGLRLALVLAGPIAAFSYFSWKVGREPRPHLHPAQSSKHDDLSWKAAAQANILHPKQPDDDDDDQERIDYTKY
jgi:hypothetical protein